MLQKMPGLISAIPSLMSPLFLFFTFHGNNGLCYNGNDEKIKLRCRTFHGEVKIIYPNIHHHGKLVNEGIIY